MERKRERARRRRLVAQLGVLHHPVDRVDAEPVRAALEPEADDALHRLHHLRVAPVEVGLLRVERVQVPASAALVAGPRGPPEGRDPVVRRPVDRRPDVPVRMLAEPGVLDRGVSRNEVEQHAEPAFVRGRDQLVEVARATPAAGRPRCSPRCRSRSLRAGRGRTARARTRPPRARPGSRAARRSRAGRRRRPHRSPGRSGDRSDRRLRRATTWRRQNRAVPGVRSTQPSPHPRRNRRNVHRARKDPQRRRHRPPRHG